MTPTQHTADAYDAARLLMQSDYDPCPAARQLFPTSAQSINGQRRTLDAGIAHLEGMLAALRQPLATAAALRELDDCALRASRVNLTGKLGPHLHHIVLTDYREQLVGIDAEIDRRLAESRLRPIDGRRTELPTEHQRDREFARAVARTL